MLNTQKLIYILHDLAYLVELLPGKQDLSFEIQNFKQYNGELIKDGKFLPENIQRLINKLEEDEYSIILPDDLFANTIIDVERESETEVKEYLKDEVIPSLHISNQSHQIETFILSEYKGTYKVQLSTIQKSLLSPLKGAFDSSKILVKGIYPLSWVVKSLISLEPSISILQMGDSLFMAKHYIGVDQSLVDKHDSLDRFTEAVKTLKGTEPSLQTAYLLTDEIIEEHLKEKLADVLPLQQLAQADNKNETDIPNHISKIVTATLRTISIPDFEIPQFSLKGVESQTIQINKGLMINKDDSTQVEVLDDDSTQVETQVSSDELPKPSALNASNLAIGVINPDDFEESVDSTLNRSEGSAEDDPEEAMRVDQSIESLDSSKVVIEKIKEEDLDLESDHFNKLGNLESIKELGSDLKADEIQQDVKKAIKISNQLSKKALDTDDEIDLSKFASTPLATVDHDKKVDEGQKPKEKSQQVLKNNDGTGGLIKIILIGLGSFALTVAVGVGIGAGLLQLTQPSEKVVEDPEIEWSEPTVEPEEPEPTPAPEISRSEYSIRVVNATTKAGYASKISNILKEAGYGEVDAKNAVESYDPGLYVLMSKEIVGLLETLSKDLEMSLEYLEGAEAEDPQDKFDAIVVLAE